MCTILSNGGVICVDFEFCKILFYKLGKIAIKINQLLLLF